MIVESNCSICGKKLGGKQRFKESRMGIFTPIVKDGEITHFAMGDNRLALCKSCTQSLYSWIKNRRNKKQTEYSGNYLIDFCYSSDPHDCGCTSDVIAFANMMKDFLPYD